MVSAALHRRGLLLALAGCGYATVFVSFVVFERPGLGIGHFYYVPVILVALAAGPVVGAAGGGIATVLYTVGVVVNPDVPFVLPWGSTAIRLFTYVVIGVLVGWYDRANENLVEELSTLANRDVLTGLPNTRAFESAIERRFTGKRQFSLLLGDVDSLGRANGLGGREVGDDALRRLADGLLSTKRPEDEVMRVGGDEFAVLASCDEAEGRALALHLELVLAHEGATITFGWASYPREGTNALALYRAADERLYARKLARGFRRETVDLRAVEGIV